MFKELQPNSYSSSNLASGENRTLDLRSIMKESTDLPAEILSADFSHIHDRILDQKVISSLTKPPSFETENGDWVTRRHRRKEALMPYLDQRLSVCAFEYQG